MSLDNYSFGAEQNCQDIWLVHFPKKDYFNCLKTCHENRLIFSAGKLKISPERLQFTVILPQLRRVIRHSVLDEHGPECLWMHTSRPQVA